MWALPDVIHVSASLLWKSYDPLISVKHLLEIDWWIMIHSMSKLHSLQWDVSLKANRPKSDIRFRLETDKNVTVCIGSEFQRFPSSFFLPSPLYKIGWLNDGLEALHPFPLNLQAQGVTGTVTEYLNNNDRNSPNSFVHFQPLSTTYSFAIDVTKSMGSQLVIAMHYDSRWVNVL